MRDNRLINVPYNTKFQRIRIHDFFFALTDYKRKKLHSGNTRRNGISVVCKYDDISVLEVIAPDTGHKMFAISFRQIQLEWNSVL